MPPKAILNPVKKTGGLYWRAILPSEKTLDHVAYIKITRRIDIKKFLKKMENSREIIPFFS
jgi:hypothetical protein